MHGRNTAVISIRVPDSVYTMIKQSAAGQRLTIQDYVKKYLTTKTNKDWGYLGIPRSAIKCVHSYQLDGSGHGFCKFCNREVQFDSLGRGEMQVIKEGEASEKGGR